MSFLSHYRLMANYNERMNKQIVSVLNLVDPKVLIEDKGAFFGSLLGTMNHLVVGDLIWLSRFASHSEEYFCLRDLSRFPTPNSLDHEICQSLGDYQIIRAALDALIIKWLAEEVQEQDFSLPLAYKNRKGVESRREFGELVAHLFNHQTHHRGQVTTLLSQMRLEVGTTDLLLDIPEI